MHKQVRENLEQIIEAHKEAVAGFQARALQTVADAAEAVTEALKKNRRVYICGNGGSAADAQHIAAELLGRFRCHRRPLPVVALTTDTSILTSIANDYCYETVFSRQVEALVEENDILWAISTSGSSPNIIAAVESAKRKGALVLAFTGKSESKLEKLADICLCANCESTARSQEIHQLAYHMICELVENSFKND